MQKNTQRNLRQKAFDDFKKLAEAQQDDGTEPLAIRRLVPLFSSAPKTVTDKELWFIGSFATRGRGDGMIQFGTELFNWSRDNRYRHS